MRLILVRHAATENNEKKLLQEDHTPLSERGEKQAELLGERLKKEKIVCIYSSPHKRTQQTAQAIAQHHSKAKVSIAQEIRERNFGIFKGKPGEEYAKWRTENKLSWSKAKPDSGESYEEVYARSRPFIEKLRHEHKGETVVIVSHGGVLTTLVLYLKGLDENKTTYDAHFHHNAAITIVDFPNFEIIGCRNHLPENLQ